MRTSVLKSEYWNITGVKFDKILLHYIRYILLHSNLIKIYLLYTCPTDQIYFYFVTLASKFYHLMDNVTK